MLMLHRNYVKRGFLTHLMFTRSFYLVTHCFFISLYQRAREEKTKLIYIKLLNGKLSCYAYLLFLLSLSLSLSKTCHD